MSDTAPLKLVKKPGKEIRIITQKGTDKLTDLYFYPVKDLPEVKDAPDVYLLCDKHDDTLAVVANGQPFMFKHDDLIWRVPHPALGSEVFVIHELAARGSFWNNAPEFTAEEGGTFTAQASGGADDDATASYAAAK